MKTLQQEFIRSKAWRRVMLAYCQYCGMTKHRAIFNETTQELVGALSDNQVRDLCCMLLGCAGLEPGEKAHLLRLLYRY